MSMSTQSGRAAAMSRSASTLERLTVTLWPAFSSRARAISVWTGAVVDDVDVERLATLSVPPSACPAGAPRPMPAPSQGGRAPPRRVAQCDIPNDTSMKRCWSQPSTLMNRLRYPQKFAPHLAALHHSHRLHDVPVAGRAGQPARLHGPGTGGLEYVMSLRQVMEPLARSRALRLLADSGDAQARAQLDEERRQFCRRWA